MSLLQTSQILLFLPNYHHLQKTNQKKEKPNLSLKFFNFDCFNEKHRPAPSGPWQRKMSFRGLVLKTYRIISQKIFISQKISIPKKTGISSYWLNTRLLLYQNLLGEVYSETQMDANLQWELSDRRQIMSTFFGLQQQATPVLWHLWCSLNWAFFAQHQPDSVKSGIFVLILGAHADSWINLTVDDLYFLTYTAICHLEMDLSWWGPLQLLFGLLHAQLMLCNLCRPQKTTFWRQIKWPATYSTYTQSTSVS